MAEKGNFEKLLDFWLTNHPESSHPCDMDRFYSMFEACETADDVYCILSIDLKARVQYCQPTWVQYFVNEFCKEWEKRIETCGHYRLFQLQK